ncbi:MAG: hypothetical protein HLUCCO16_14220 [Phormidium sp. OSCR]|nr:MAG: hypothetical protein HLUCCO16_14220 [Phormidium sp. OSCR]
MSTSTSASIVFSYLFPARGRKLNPGAAHRSHIPLKSFPIFSPQGDGNLRSCFFSSNRNLHVFSYLFPARGRKLACCRPTTQAAFKRLFLSFPRKGTETPVLFRVFVTVREVFSYLFPARGRKPGAAAQQTVSVKELSFPIFSPQGDGNISLQFNLAGILR